MVQETSDMNEPILHSAPAEGFGAALKRAREAQGISIGDMAARSRLSVQQVRALEDETLDELPEPVYVRAFIRGVAQVLGLDSDPLVADYSARYGAASVGVIPDHDPNTETVVSASGSRTGIKAAAIAVAVVLACAGGWYVWSSMSAAEPGVELPAPAADVQKAQAPEAAPEMTAEAKAAEEKAEAEKTAADKTAAEKEAAEKAASEKAAAQKAAAEKAAAEKAAAEKARAEKARAQEQAAVVSERRVALSTSGACWVQILLPNGRNLFAKEMAAGGSEVLNVPVGARVTVGNASAMTITVDGRSFELDKSTRNGICRFVVK